MKIVIPDLPVPILLDIAQCLETVKDTAGIHPLLWNAQHKSLMDMSDEIQPDLLFIHLSQIDQAFMILCQETNFPYVVVADSWPVDQEDNLVSCPRPAAAILTSPMSMGPWPPATPVLVVKDAARVAQIHGGKYKESLYSEVLIHTSGLEITPKHEALFRFLCSKYNTKIVGNSVVPLHNYLGTVSMSERADLMQSAKIVVDFTGQDVWDACYLKTAPICAKASEPHWLTFHNPTTLQNSIDSLLSNEPVWNKYVSLCYDDVCDGGHTCYHFTANIFNTLQIPHIAQCLLTMIEELINDRNS